MMGSTGKAEDFAKKVLANQDTEGGTGVNRVRGGGGVLLLLKRVLLRGEKE